MSKTAITRIAFLAIAMIIVAATIMWNEHSSVNDDIATTLSTEVKFDEETVVNEIKPVVTDPAPAPEPVGSKSKTYMDYRMITNTNSAQWDLIQTLTVCDDGMLRDNDGYIAAALGSAFGPIGSRYVFVLEGGKELLIIKADQKQDQCTCENNIFGLANWDIIEFIVDTSKMPVWNNGYVYGGNFNNNPEYAGDIVSWTKM